MFVIITIIITIIDYLEMFICDDSLRYQTAYL